MKQTRVLIGLVFMALALPFFVTAEVITSQGIADEVTVFYSGADNLSVFAQKLGTGLSGTVTSVTYAVKVVNTLATLGFVLYECTDNTYGSCSSVISLLDDQTVYSAGGDKQFVSFTNFTPYVLVSNKYYYIKYISGQRYNVWGSTLGTQGLYDQSDPTASADAVLKNSYYLIQGLQANSVAVVYPVDGLYGAVDFPSWGLRVPVTYASTTVKMVVSYGTITNSYVYSDSGFIYSTNINSFYNVRRDSSIDLSLGTPAIPQTWYVQAKVYADFGNDGVFSDLISTSDEISFVYYPDGVIFNSQVGTSTGSSYINVYSGTSTCPAGLVCTAPDGSNFYIDSQGNIINTVPTTTIDQSFFGKFYSLWLPLQFKVPWGYISLLTNAINNFASSTGTTTTFMATTTSKLNWTANYQYLTGYITAFGEPFEYVKTGIGVGIYVLTALAMIKIIILFI